MREEWPKSCDVITFYVNRFWGLFGFSFQVESKILLSSPQVGGQGGRRRQCVGTCCSDCCCMGSSPQIGSMENGHWEGPLHRRCPNDPKQDVRGRPAHDS